ncbi:MAG: hypothetical protein PF541_03100 [Prolixibacteraceae bacterium]|jgi:hypothetical protein|nr:hypothetical protein [Prolixibacteraceae bacterium]
MKILFNTYLLQIETVGPEGGIIFLFIVALALLVTFFLFILKKKNLKFPSFSNGIKVSISKNKIYHPTIVQLSITNKSSRAITIEHPVIRFKKFRTTTAYKIKTVNNKQIYPLFLEAKQTHSLPVKLQPFYDFNKKLSKFFLVRIEFKYNKTIKKSSKYLLLKPTILRKAKR